MLHESATQIDAVQAGNATENAAKLAEFDPTTSLQAAGRKVSQAQYAE